MKEDEEDEEKRGANGLDEETREDDDDDEDNEDPFVDNLISQIDDLRNKVKNKYKVAA